MIYPTPEQTSTTLPAALKQYESARAMYLTATEPIRNGTPRSAVWSEIQHAERTLRFAQQDVAEYLFHHRDALNHGD